MVARRVGEHETKAGRVAENEKSKIRKKIDEAKQEYEELGGAAAFRRGDWLWRVIQKSFQNYWARANAEYFRNKYPTRDEPAIARKLIAVAAKNASLLGAVVGATVSADEIVAIATAGEGGVGIPANIAIALAAVSAEAILLVRIQMQLVVNIAKVYGIPLDPDDPEDILTILAFALGGSAAEAAGKAGMKLGAHVVEVSAKKLLQKDALEAMERVAARIGIRIVQRSIVKYAVPAASIGIGLGWNYLTTRAIGKAAIRHFEQRLRRLREEAAPDIPPADEATPEP
jgi:uncharacterized protein (DUF697 family)